METAETFYFVPGALFTSLISVLKDISILPSAPSSSKLPKVQISTKCVSYVNEQKRWISVE